MTPLLHFSAGSISLIPRSTFKNRKKETSLNKCNFTRKPLLLCQPAFPLNWISTRNISKTQILTSAVEADVAVEADPSSNPETSGEPEPVSDQTEQAASTPPTVEVKQVRSSKRSDLPRVKNEDVIPGATFTGVVRSIQPFGLFVDIGTFTDGLVHISQISSSFVKDVKELFTIGQEVQVRVLEANMEKRRISLTMRSPGDEKKEGPPKQSSRGSSTGTGRGKGRKPRYTEGAIMLGTVKELTQEGALVTLPGGGEGFLPVSEQVGASGSAAGATLEEETVSEEVAASGSQEGATLEEKPVSEQVAESGSQAGATLEVGQDIEVRVLSVVRGQVKLTMKEEIVDKKGDEDEFFKVDSDRGFEVLEQVEMDYDEVEEGEEGGEDTGGVVEDATIGDPTVEVDDGTISVNPFVFTFLRSRYAANAQKRLESIGAVRKEGSIVAASAASVSGDSGGEVAVAGDGSEVGSASAAEEPVAVAEVEGGELAAVGAVSETVSAPVVEEPVAISELGGGEVAAIGATSETASHSVSEEPVAASGLEGGEVAAVDGGSVPESASEGGSVSVAEEPVAVSEGEKGELSAAVAVPEVTESELVSESTKTESSSGATESTSEAPVLEEQVPVTSEVDTGEVGVAETVPEVSESEGSSQIGSTSVSEERVVVSEVEKGEVAAASDVPAVAETQVASDSTVTEASSGTTESTVEAPFSDEMAAQTSELEVGEVAVIGVVSDSTVSETSVSDGQAVLSENGASKIVASGETEAVSDGNTEEAVSINVGDEKTAVSEATSEASPNQAHEVKATISPALVKQLRDETGAGMMDCKKALAVTNGDLAKAQEYLRTKGLASADKKASRATAEGRIGSYVHDGRIGVLIEVNCETDFVSRGDIFRELVEDLAMQAAACPQVTYLTSDEVPEETVRKEKEIEMQREDILSKPENIREKIVEGRIRKRLEEFALLDQPFIKNDKVVVKDYVKQVIAKIGENIKVKRFVRLNLGEGLEKKSQDFAAEVAAQTAAKPASATAVAGPPKDEKAEITETAEKAPAATVTISPALVKQLREETGAGMMDCKKALAETGGDIEKAQEYLRKKGLSSADKKSSRLASEGLIAAYIHDSRIGCLLEVNSETDFVARNEKFKELVNDLAMQVVACPQVEYVSIDEVPASVVEKEKTIEMQREDLQSKPEQIRQKIVEGRISKRLGELALLEQPFIKDDSVTVKELVKKTIASLGENIKIRRFVRFTLGESKD